MKAPRRKSETVKLSVSLSKTVYAWAVELADEKGFDTNFSAYIADLIRRELEREQSKGGVIAPASAAGRGANELNEPQTSYGRK